MKKSDISPDELMEIILQEYGTITAFANAMKMSRQNATNKIKRGSQKFLAKLRKEGVLKNKGIYTDNQQGNNYQGGNANIIGMIEGKAVTMRDYLALRDENENLKLTIKNLNNLIGTMKEKSR